MRSSPTADLQPLVGRRRWVSIAVLGSIYFAMGIAIDLLIVLAPSVAETFAIPTSIAVRVITIRASAKLVAPLLGYLSDRVGRKQILLFSLALLGAGNLGSAFVGAFIPFLGFQALAGLGLAGLQVSLPAYLGDLIPYESRGRVMGFAKMWMPIGIIVGIPAGVYLTQIFGLKSALLALAAVIFIQIPIASFYLAAVSPHSVQLSVDRVRQQRPATLRPQGWAFAIIPTFLWTTMSVAIWVFMSSWLNQELNIPMSQIAFIWSGLAIVSALAFSLVAVISDRVGKLRAALGALLLSLASIIVLSQAESVWLVLPSLIIFVLANEFGHSAYEVVVTELQPMRRGIMMSAYWMSIGVAAVISPVLGGVFWDRGGFSLLTLSISSLGILAFFLALRFSQRGEIGIGEVSASG